MKTISPLVRRMAGAIAVLVGMAVGKPAAGAPTLNPNNGHYYEFVATEMSWAAASNYATTNIFMGMAGHLATITDAAENTWLREYLHLHSIHGWVGGYQEPAGEEPAGGWKWVDGTPFTFTGWIVDNVTEPNDVAGNDDNIELITPAARPGLGWNDRSGLDELPFIIEWSPRREAISRELTVFVSEAAAQDGRAEAISRELTVFAAAPSAPEGASEAISRELTVFAAEASPSIAHIVIDDFEHGPFRLEDSIPDGSAPGTGVDSLPPTSTINGYRGPSVLLWNGGVGTAIAELNLAGGGDHGISLTVPANSTAGAGILYPQLPQVDLRRNGATTLRFRFLSDPGNGTLTIGATLPTGPVSATVPLTGAGVYLVPFSTFDPSGGDFSRVSELFVLMTYVASTTPVTAVLSDISAGAAGGEAISRELTVFASAQATRVPGYGEAISREATVFAAFTGGEDQTITFNAIPDMSFPAAPYTLVATASSGLPVGFDVVAGPATVNDANTLVITGAGEIAVRAFQEGNTTWNTATPVTNRFAVSGALQIRSHPQNRELVQGQTANLNLIAVGTPPLVYQWYHRDTPLGWGTNATLTIENVQPEHAGLYKVTVSNGDGTLTSQNALLTVLEPPRFLAMPRDQIVFLGGDALFEAEVAGTGPFGFQWIARTNVVFEPFGTGTNRLLIAGVETNLHRATFELLVTNRAYPLGIRSDRALLLVDNPPKLLSQPQSRTVSLDEEGVTLCVEVSSPTEVLYQWQKNGVNLLDETNDCLTLPRITPNSGGSYSAVIVNDFGTTETAPAVISVDVPLLNFADHFEASTLMTQDRMVGRGDNRGATAQVGERDHAGKPGTNSVWLSWRAPNKGIATFSTVGSSFDTLLGVYRGASLNTLVEVASDEDTGDYLTSIAQFNAEKDEVYHIAIAGFFDDAGEIVLSWNLQVTLAEIPVIKTAPVDVTAAPGTQAEFTVEAVNPAGVTYLWRFNNNPLINETQPKLTIPAVTTANVGQYSVTLRNVDGREVTSVPVSLDMSAQTQARMENKLGDLLETGDAPFLVRQAGAQAGYRGLVVGNVARVEYTSSAVGDTTEANGLLPCHGPYNADSFAWLTVTNAGLLEISSGDPSVVAIMLLPPLDADLATALVCGDQNTSNRRSRNRVVYPVVAGEEFVISVVTRNGDPFTFEAVVRDAHIDVTLLPDGKLQFKNLQPMGVYQIEWSPAVPNRRLWTPEWSGTVPSGELIYTTLGEARQGTRFYRIRRIK